MRGANGTWRLNSDRLLNVEVVYGRRVQALFTHRIEMDRQCSTKALNDFLAAWCCREDDTDITA